jgi:hypothetical protein
VKRPFRVVGGLVLSLLLVACGGSSIVIEGLDGSAEDMSSGSSAIGSSGVASGVSATGSSPEPSGSSGESTSGGMASGSSGMGSGSSVAGSSGTASGTSGVSSGMGTAGSSGVASGSSGAASGSPACNPGFAACGGNGCVINLETDAQNCGMCGRVCPQSPHATPTCSAGHCGVTCLTGFKDCDGSASNGCETNVEIDDQNCGSCGNMCTSANGAPKCTAGSCGIASCDPGFKDCNNTPVDGCETDIETDPNNCGACASPCALAHATSNCTGGNCAVTMCSVGYRDCNGMAADGCEVDIDTDPMHCGSCTSPCNLANAVPNCAGRVCGIATCNTGFKDCNGTAADGCEVDIDTDPNNCGACASPCALAHATAQCTSGSCAIGMCTGPYRDCNNMAADGCESNIHTDVQNCGGCQNACNLPNATPECDAGTCQITTCNMGFGDCNTDPSDGCEVDFSSDNQNCGSCGFQCFPGSHCFDGACGF